MIVVYDNAPSGRPKFCRSMAEAYLECERRKRNYRDAYGPVYTLHYEQDVLTVDTMLGYVLRHILPHAVALVATFALGCALAAL